MIYSIVRLFELIDQPKDKNEFYYDVSNGGLGIDCYTNDITGFKPEDTRILWGFGDEEPLAGLDIYKESICTYGDEILLFECNGHSGDFIVKRMKNMDEVLEFMYGDVGISNQFTGDICIICGNKRRKYYVRDSMGKIITYNNMHNDDMDMRNIKLDFHIEFE